MTATSANAARKSRSANSLHSSRSLRSLRTSGNADPTLPVQRTHCQACQSLSGDVLPLCTADLLVSTITQRPKAGTDRTLQRPRQ